MSTNAAILDAVRALPAHYAARLPAADADQLQTAVTVGEWAWGLQDLTAALILANAPITAAERDNLQKLGKAVGLELTALDALVSSAPNGTEQRRESKPGRATSRSLSRDDDDAMHNDHPHDQIRST